MPALNATLQAGQPLFAVRQGMRRIQFFSPVSGRVVKVNPSLARPTPELETTTDHRHWVCVISGEKLDVEIPALKIGNAAVALFHDDIARFTAFMQAAQKPDQIGGVVDNALCIGAMEKLNDEQWTRVAGMFFGRSG
jgi:hypothetical protein